ncbi:hypothetical protein N008_16915 [Hymenobacter sp. APR13]|nr:hypothetical protein N008_16915 [Hymenobacter sp. APR13]
MRNLMLLLFGGIGLLLATACSAPAYVKEKGPDLTTLHQQARHVHLDTEVAPVAAEQVGVAQLAAVLDQRGQQATARTGSRTSRQGLYTLFYAMYSKIHIHYSAISKNGMYDSSCKTWC